MSEKDFFLHIEKHYTSQLPFVAYRKPNKTIVKALFQNNSTIHIVDDFSENGFIFSPFDSEHATIIFPSEHCNMITSEMSFSSEIVPKNNRELHDESKREHHVNLVQKGIDHITTDSVKKIVLSRVETVPISEDTPLDIFQSLLNHYQNAFVYIWYHPEIGLWLGATPETLLNVEGQRFKTMSLAGTQPYNGHLNVDWNLKNKEEQQFVTDFIIDGLKPFVERLNSTEAMTIRAGQLLHLKSEIFGTLKPDCLKDVIHTLHPTPAVCGLPKHNAKAFILSNENYNREFYTGFLGELNIKTTKTRNTNRRNVENNAYASVKTTSQLYVNLRCMQIKDQHAMIYVGGGVTKDSNPLEEWDETVNKAQTMLSVLT
ncbi:chorismate-binding protein [uncultured Psychroserpens sp.]|uniref:chorismate-binding protein n=1 Tax=uncultured Psychroserpens sp. TaxID=255436 RepID=UPI0026080E04|nr:chorismate-binding protein [uncultured Psychroserpens sp.]